MIQPGEIYTHRLERTIRLPQHKGLTKSARLRDKAEDSVIFWHTYLAGYTARGSGSILNS